MGLTVAPLPTTRSPGDGAFRVHQSQPDGVPADWAEHILCSTTVHLVADPSVPAHRDRSKPCKRGIEKDVFNLVRSIAYTRELPASTANRHRAGWRKTGSSHQDWVGSKDVHSRDEYSASTGSHGPYNEARKRNKRHTDYKWELKLSLFTDNVVACHPGIHKKPNWGNEISKIQSQRQKS